MSKIYRELETQNKLVAEMLRIQLADTPLAFQVTHTDGTNRKLYCFVYQGELAFHKRGNKGRGEYISRYYHITEKVISAFTIVPRPTKIENMVTDAKKFQKAFVTRCHPNLWSNLQKGYESIDFDNFLKFEKDIEIEPNGYNDNLYRLWLDFTKDITIVVNNRYKTTTIKSNAPRPRARNNYSHNGVSYYTQCVDNIKKHLDNKEDFRYSWRANYDVTVEGKTGSDGIYRAWLSLEYYGCGNGHYYLLINENSAVFSDSD